MPILVTGGTGLSFGAHESDVVGELPSDIPSNLMPYVDQVDSGQRAHLGVFGNDNPTPDATGAREYITVMDLAEGHVAALDLLQREGGLQTVNLRRCSGYYVLYMLRFFEKASTNPLSYAIAPRRPGDIYACYADPALAELLGSKAKRSIDEMCRDTWCLQRRQSEN